MKAAQLPLDALSIDRESPEPIQRQIYAALRDLILRRVLTPGLKLPSTRELSQSLMVSRNKGLSKKVLAHHGIKVPGFITCHPEEAPPNTGAAQTLMSF